MLIGKGYAGINSHLVIDLEGSFLLGQFPQVHI